MAGSVEAAWSNYRDALGAVFPQPSTDSFSRLTAVESVDTSDEALERLLAGSSGLEEAIVSEDSPSGAAGEKELSSLKLLAGAALDVDTANRLAVLARDDLGEVSTGQGGAVGSTLFGSFLGADELAQLEAIIRTPPGQAGLLLDGAPDRVLSMVASSAPPVDAEALKKAVDDAIDSIVADSSAFAGKTLKGLITVGSSEILDAVGKGVDEVFGHLAAGLKRIAKHIANLVWNAIKKLLAIFGQDAGKLLKKVADWFVGLDADQIDKLLAKVFSVDALKKKLGDEVDAKANNPGSDLAGAATGVSDLAAHLHKQLSILGKIAWLLQKTQGFFLDKVAPWGTLAVVVVWVAGTGYAVDVAEDYLDWGEKPILDRIPGVKHIVESHLAAA